MRNSVLILALVFGQSMLASDVGSVCVAPVDKPNDGAKSLANPSGGNKIQRYSVQIDGRNPVEVDANRAMIIGAIEAAGRHSIKISGDGKSVTGFHFRFSDYPSRDLCLWMKPLYETWSLTVAKGHGKSCLCR